jgi:RNA polymerase sigma factor (sigma-70 family)
VQPNSRGEDSAQGAAIGEAARRRAAIETYARHEATLRRTARRYSLCADDADDALQRALEILLKKAPSEDPRELIRWTQTVVKHEALAVRRERERILAGPAAVRPEPDAEDWVATIPSRADGPAERAERHEAVARSREALQSLKPQELRALTLLAEGYSYREIGEITGYSQTKINRCLAEGRERFRRVLARSEDGSRCAEMRPLISAFCDGETAAEETATVREHLRVCSPCRATLRAYRAAPAAAALAPALPLGRGLFERAHDAAAGLAARLGGGPGTDSALGQVAAAGGTRGAGLAALAKVAAICVGTVGGAAACVATGVVPAPVELGGGHERPARMEQPLESEPSSEPVAETGVDYETEPQPGPTPEKQQPQQKQSSSEPEATATAPEPEASSGAVEYAPPAAVASTGSAASTSPSVSGSSSSAAAGEFGP